MTSHDGWTEHLGAPGYLPHRITPDPRSRHPLSAGTWRWITRPATPHT